MMINVFHFYQLIDVDAYNNFKEWSCHSTLKEMVLSQWENFRYTVIYAFQNLVDATSMLCAECTACLDHTQ